MLCVYYEVIEAEEFVVAAVIRIRRTLYYTYTYMGSSNINRTFPPPFKP